MSTWIYVTNLPLFYDEVHVNDIFSGIGQILSTKLSKDQLTHKCTAMVEFSHSKHAKVAAAMHHKRGTHNTNNLGIRVYVIWCPLETLSTVRCYNIDPNCTTIELEKYFNPFGDIVNIQIMDNCNQIQSKPYALISFSRVDYAVYAVKEMNGTMIGLGGALCVELVNADARNLQWKRHAFEYISLNYKASNCAMNSIDKLLLSPLHNTSNGKYRTYSIVNTTPSCSNTKNRGYRRNNHERMCDMMETIIYGFIRRHIGWAILRTRSMEIYHKQEMILSEIMNVTFYYCCFEARILETEASQLPLYVRDPTVPSPPKRRPPSPPKRAKKPIKMIKKIVVERADQREKSLAKDAPVFIPAPASSSSEGSVVKKVSAAAAAVINSTLEGKYQQIFDIYRDRLDAIEGKMSVTKEEFDSISLNMSRTMIALEQRRINDINTIQKQFNSTITALCYQINNQINNQIKIMTTKMESVRKENVDRIDDLEEELCQMKKENDVLRKQQKINKILKPKTSGALEVGEGADTQKESEISMSETDKLKLWLSEKVKLAQYLDLFVNNGYDDLESMQDITFGELEQIGINKMGHRKKLVKYAAKLVFIDTRSSRNKHAIRHHKSSTSSSSSAASSASSSSSMKSGGSNNGNSAVTSPNSSATGSGTTHSSLYSHNIWSDDSVSSIPWTYAQNQNHSSN